MSGQKGRFVPPMGYNAPLREANGPGGGILPPSTVCIQMLCLYTFVCAIIITEEIYKRMCMRLMMSKNMYM